ncbi:ATP-dependent RNA helicase DeaD [Pseudonocardia sediminis]|uniref:ATP-dependent RNA helicase DeaD n=1 Tax=Pseudonocardia sediminis TaxID=1397368 RepID=A0A4V6MEB4_PSEST|nr:DEAD/DEAH box helicase [Pseudonocardia sediminis]RZT86060.1 ATP-dependent RNA helicase DeaD [Pseudonocardia sediminis]
MSTLLDQALINDDRITEIPDTSEANGDIADIDTPQNDTAAIDTVESDTVKDDITENDTPGNDATERPVDDTVTDEAAENDTDDDTDDEPESTGTTFADLGLAPQLLRELEGLGYEHPSPIQAESIVPLIAGRDLLGQAATGTGKTAAFALPMLQRLTDGRAGKSRGSRPFGLVLAPTRELAMQVGEAVARYGRNVGAKVVTVYGGAPIGPQLGTLRRGVDIVVATPGRAIDLLNRNALSLDAIEVAVLDEADEMLDMGFIEDIDLLLDATPATRQTVLFSATMPSRIVSLARKHLNDPVDIRMGKVETPEGEAPKVRQTAYNVPRSHVTVALGRVLEMERPTAAIVFCRTRADVDAVTETLTGRGLRAEALHGGMDQEHRTRVVERLRAGRTDLLVATDVAARGLDIDSLTHVVNHDVPSSPEAYVHRIGRVGRAGREGVAITLVTPGSVRHLRGIERLTGTTVPVAPVPTVQDLRDARLARTAVTIAEQIEAGSDNDGVDALVLELAQENDLQTIAAAAIRMARAGTAVADDEIDIPEVRAPRGGAAGGRDARGPRREGPGGPGGARGQGSRPPKAGTTRLFVSAGRASGVRPQDIVGALANESRLSGRDIGAIQIHERHALVEVPEHAADDVVKSLRGATTLKGRKANVRRDRDAAGAR